MIKDNNPPVQLYTPAVAKAYADKYAKQKAKQAHADLLEFAKHDGIGIVHIHNVQGGITIAFSPANEHKSCRMVKVAVQTCSINDTFNRRLGTAGALMKFYAEDTIQLPLLDNYDKEDLAYVVKQAFSALYEASR
jgi:isocitrate dehydrogenase